MKSTKNERMNGMKSIIIDKNECIDKRKAISIICILASAWMILTFVSATAYSVLSADDFGHAARIGLYQASFTENMKEAFKYSRYMYNNWQGTYFSMFLQILFSPVNNYGLLQLRVIMVINACLFFCVVILWILSLVRKIDTDGYNIRFFLLMLIIYLIVGYESYHEVFFWYSGAVSYSIPMTLVMVGLWLFNNDSISFKKTIIAIIIGFFAMGGSLAVVGIGCYLGVIICISKYLQKKLSKKHVFILLQWLLFAIINAIAPGNYVRHRVIDQSGIHPFQAVYYSLNMADERWQFFFRETSFPFVIVLVFICGIFMGKGYVHQKSGLLISVLILALPIIAAYPIALGYTGQTIVNRAAFVIDMTIVGVSVFLAITSGAIIRRAYMGRIRDFLVVACLIAATCFMLDGFGLQDVNIRFISYMLRAGIYQDHYLVTKEFYDTLSNCEKGTDVRFKSAEIPYQIKNIQNFYFTENPGHNMNVDIAAYYGFNSIAISDE